MKEKDPHNSHFGLSYPPSSALLFALCVGCVCFVCVVVVVTSMCVRGWCVLLCLAGPPLLLLRFSLVCIVADGSECCLVSEHFFSSLYTLARFWQNTGPLLFPPSSFLSLPPFLPKN